MPLTIGNAQAFWGDSPDAPARLVAQSPDLDFLTLDYLAEVSLSILAQQMEKDSQAGYARDFLGVVKSLIPFWKAGRSFKVVCNAGGLNPRACALAVRGLLEEAGLGRMKVGLVHGDDVLPILRQGLDRAEYSNLETGESLASIQDRLVTANAYLGTGGVRECLSNGAEVIVTGRVADPSLTLACAQHAFGWSDTDYDLLAAGTMAGHLIECGTQVTGGISTDWLELENPSTIGFPLVEIEPDGTVVVTKPQGTAGRVNRAIVSEQLLYEIGDPGRYLSPDVTVSLLGAACEEVGPDRVVLRGVRGSAPTSTYKVSGTYRDGFWAQGQLTVFGNQAVAKARRCGEVILARLAAAGVTLERTSIECLGAGDSIPGGWKYADQMLETVLRVAVADPRREAVERFSREMAPLVTSGPPGVTGYAAGRPKVHPIFAYWPCLISKTSVQTHSEIL